ncbi:MAG: ATP-binding protein [Pirellulales bacterium]
MKLATYNAECRALLSQAESLIDAPVWPVRLDSDLESKLLRHLQLEVRAGLEGQPHLLTFDESTRGHELNVGFERYRFRFGGPEIPLVRVCLPFDADINDFWVVPRRKVGIFYRAVRKLLRRTEAASPPLMPAHDWKRLWENTIGYLRSAASFLKQFGVPAKRGLLLLGAPGNGKTMAGRYLRSRCRSAGLTWRTVTPSEFEEAYREKTVAELFQPERSGIVMFDDFDAHLRRSDDGHDGPQAALLGGLDGIGQPIDVVYLFSTNLPLEEIDAAVRRPGRIDIVIHFAKPDTEMRRQLIVTRWQAEIVDALDVEHVVAETAEMSFAELEEARRLLVMRRFETGRWDWPAVRRALGERNAMLHVRRRIGFSTAAPALSDAPAGGLCANRRLQ